MRVVIDENADGTPAHTLHISFWKDRDRTLCLVRENDPKSIPVAQGMTTKSSSDAEWEGKARRTALTRALAGFAAGTRTKVWERYNKLNPPENEWNPDDIVFIAMPKNKVRKAMGSVVTKRTS